MFSIKPLLWQHQLAALGKSEAAPVFALFMDPRTGKTRVIIENAHWLVREKGLNALAIIAPNGVHRNWVTDELPAWADFKYEAHVWRSATSTRAEQVEQRAALLATSSIAVLAVNVEALRLDRCFKYFQQFLRERKAMLVIDESQVIATPGAAQTKRARVLGKHAAWRRILTGTPATESPFQLYSQFAFLDMNIIGTRTYAEFKAHYGEWEQGYAYHQGRTYPKVVSYRNVDELMKKIAPYTFRQRREDCTDLPRKVYQKIYFQLTAPQRAAYDQVRDEAKTDLHDGRAVSASTVLAKMLRLQQITSNYWPAATEVRWHEPCDGEGCEGCGFLGIIEKDVPATEIDPTKNARLDAVAPTILEELNRGGSIIMWCRFKHDVEQVMRWARATAFTAVARYDGTVAAKARDTARLAFREKQVHLLAATSAAARGLDFSTATMMLYYSNNFSLEQRIQSEDRAEAHTRPTGTQVIDVVAEDTVDATIVEALRAKRSLADMIAGDPAREWI